MAKETTDNIELVTVELNQEKIDEIKILNNQINQIVNQLGQLHIRKNELSSELENIDKAFTKAEETFVDTNSEMRKELNKLEKDYPRGQLDLEAGTIKYNKALKEQLANQSQNPNGVEGGGVVQHPFS